MTSKWGSLILLDGENYYLHLLLKNKENLLSDALIVSNILNGNKELIKAHKVKIDKEHGDAQIFPINAIWECFRTNDGSYEVRKGWEIESNDQILSESMENIDEIEGFEGKNLLDKYQKWLIERHLIKIIN